MKQYINIPKRRFIPVLCLAVLAVFAHAPVKAQDNADASAATAAPKLKPVKNTFQSIWLIDDQTVMVPVKGTFELDIMHRFGTVQNGVQDLWGLFASANMRLGFNYAPINNLYVSTGLTKTKMLWDGSVKYAILKQTKHKYPVSVTYYGDMAYDTRKDPNKVLFTYGTDRLSYFNQLIVARKFSEKFSLQAAISVSHQNAVNGYYTEYDSAAKVKFADMKFDHIALAVGARFKLTPGTAIIVDYDQPLTKHPTNNPTPNIAFGFEFNTSGHTFQLFAGNYTLLNPQQNNLYNKNAPFGYTKTDGTKVGGGQFVIGFNITRLWNF
ncbi:MAG TPA: DUF5777 family beta-barrel protein [Chitinophagaceae bacterium]|nr:DUF5777 family beta-barrel protein [Chitinophagaceae bacterium]